MIKSGLLGILKKLSQKEIRELGEYINSPFFNKNQSVRSLYNYLKKYYPDFEEKYLLKEYVYSKLFEGAEYNDGFMRTLLFHLTKLTMDYLTYASLIRSRPLSGILLLEELNERKLEKQLTKAMPEILKNIEESGKSDPFYYYYKFRYDNVLSQYYNWRRYKVKDYKDYENANSLDVINNLTRFFLSRALTYYRFLLHKIHFETIEIDLPLIDKIVDFLQTDNKLFTGIPKIDYELNAVLMLREQDEKYYYRLKDMLINLHNTMSPGDRYSILNLLQLYCIQRYYRGDSGFMNERFRLYKLAIDEKLYKDPRDEFFDDILFGNITMVAVNCREYDWARNFIEKYSPELQAENRHIVENFSYARLYNALGDHSKALEHLSRIKSAKHIQYKIVIRNTILVCYYELGFYSQAYAMLDSQRHFINKSLKGMTADRISAQYNFIKNYTKLLKAKETDNKNTFFDMKPEIENAKNLPDRLWMLSKINEVVGKN